MNVNFEVDFAFRGICDAELKIFVSSETALHPDRRVLRILGCEAVLPVVSIWLKFRAGACPYLGSRPDSAINDRMTAFVKLKGDSFFAMMLPRPAQLIECLDMLFGKVHVSGIRLQLQAAAA